MEEIFAQHERNIYTTRNGGGSPERPHTVSQTLRHGGCHPGSDGGVRGCNGAATPRGRRLPASSSPAHGKRQPRSHHWQATKGPSSLQKCRLCMKQEGSIPHACPVLVQEDATCSPGKSHCFLSLLALVLFRKLEGAWESRGRSARHRVSPCQAINTVRKMVKAEEPLW
jgi:hypothetical protein